MGINCKTKNNLKSVTKKLLVSMKKSHKQDLKIREMIEKICYRFFLDVSAYFPHCFALNAKGCLIVLIGVQVAPDWTCISQN